MDCALIEHPRFRRVQKDIFTKRVVKDCMSHECKLTTKGDAVKLDACCQYGVDVDLGERDGILAHAEQIRSILSEEARDQEWFIGPEHEDVDFVSGRYVRTNRVGDGCLFLSHDGRGCAIHRASIEGDWNFSGIKPHVCRLFPLTYTGDLICLSDDYPDYSCAYDPDAETVYRNSRDDLGEFFGAELISTLDALEQTIMVEAGSAFSTDEARVRLPIA